MGRLFLFAVAAVALAVGVAVYDARTAAYPADGPPLGSGAMFTTIAGRYDVINRVMALGMDQYWRSEMLSALEVGPGDAHLDLATGTADVAILSAQRGAGPVLGIDPAAGMLAVGRDKVTAASLDGSVTLVLGDAQRLDGVAGETYDKVTISFGIRNVPDRGAALREMSRVVKRDGRVGILEFAEPTEGFLAPAASFFVHNVVPLAGAVLSGKYDEYMHLHRSIAAFPTPPEWANIMRDNGLFLVAPPRAMPLTFGAVMLYVAEPAPKSE